MCPRKRSPGAELALAVTRRDRPLVAPSKAFPSCPSRAHAASREAARWPCTGRLEGHPAAAAPPGNGPGDSQHCSRRPFWGTRGSDASGI